MSGKAAGGRVATAFRRAQKECPEAIAAYGLVSGGGDGRWGDGTVKLIRWTVVWRVLSFFAPSVRESRSGLSNGMCAPKNLRR